MKERILMLVFVLVLGGILTSALVIVDDFTKPMIEKNEAIRLQSSVLDSLAVTYEPVDVESTFAANVEELVRDERTYYRAKDGRLALPYEGSGLWGPIIGILAMDSGLVKITGLTIMQQEETPGLGSRIADQEYLDLFIAKAMSKGLVLVQPGRASNDREIDSISGATMSSRAFIDVLNDEYTSYASLLAGGGE